MNPPNNESDALPAASTTAKLRASAVIAKLDRHETHLQQLQTDVAKLATDRDSLLKDVAQLTRTINTQHNTILALKVQNNGLVAEQQKFQEQLDGGSTSSSDDNSDEDDNKEGVITEGERMKIEDSLKAYKDVAFKVRKRH
jgi:hypothetical protein